MLLFNYLIVCSLYKDLTPSFFDNGKAVIEGAPNIMTWVVTFSEENTAQHSIFSSLELKLNEIKNTLKSLHIPEEQVQLDAVHLTDAINRKTSEHDGFDCEARISFCTSKLYAFESIWSEFGKLASLEIWQIQFDVSGGIDVQNRCLVLPKSAIRENQARLSAFGVQDRHRHLTHKVYLKR